MQRDCENNIKKQLAILYESVADFLDDLLVCQGTFAPSLYAEVHCKVCFCIVSVSMFLKIVKEKKRLLDTQAQVGKLVAQFQ